MCNKFLYASLSVKPKVGKRIVCYLYMKKQLFDISRNPIIIATHNAVNPIHELFLVCALNVNRTCICISMFMCYELLIKSCLSYLSLPETLILQKYAISRLKGLENNPKTFLRRIKSILEMRFPPQNPQIFLKMHFLGQNKSPKTYCSDTFYPFNTCLWP